MSDEDKFLGRIREKSLQHTLDGCSLKLNQLANIGVKILKREMQQGSSGGEYLIPALLFIRNQCEIVESISTLIKDSLIDPCWPLLRVSLETYLQLEYLLQKEKERGSAFIVWHTHKSISTYKKMDGVSEEYKHLKAKFLNDHFAKGGDPRVYEGAQKAIANDELILKKDEYKNINKEFLKLKKEKKKTNWYSLFNGPPNIEKLASHCNLEATYDIIYRAWSSYSHGTDILRGKISANHSGHLQIHQVRNSTQAKQVTLHCFNIVGLSFNTFVEKRVPSIKNDFKEWYLSIEAFHNGLNN